MRYSLLNLSAGRSSVLRACLSLRNKFRLPLCISNLNFDYRQICHFDTQTLQSQCIDLINDHHVN
jgi:hypothetical protein